MLIPLISAGYYTRTNILIKVIKICDKANNNIIEKIFWLSGYQAEAKNRESLVRLYSIC